ncbi:MAG: hypothetical protein QOH49_1233 [Acidobacteriota bacterium]|nr:hypothetical protein [Acidobacteriota bacterium]
MRKALSAAVLVLAFCCPVSAGIIHNPPLEPTPMLETADALDALDAKTAAPGVSDSLTKITVDLLAVSPALF